MSLDQNLFTLNVVPNAEDPNVVDLAEPSGTLHYEKRRIPGSTYSIEIYDPITESLLATATAPSATSKYKTIELHNPDIAVELRFTGTLTFKWGFHWEDHDFEWRREECFILRKPDPAVLVAITKEPTGRLKSTSVQILDYNLNRFDVEDRKGLEIVILTALLTFHDSNDAFHEEAANSASPSGLAGLFGGLSLGNRRPSTPALPPPLAYDPSTSATAPQLPPRPPPRTGVERISELHMIRTLQGDGEANEVEVNEEGSVEDYAQYVHQLLQDDAMLFVTVRSASSVQVPKVLRVVEETKRLRHKSGISDELHQYVLYDTESSSASMGPRRINLNDPPQKDKQRSDYAPPNNLIVHLSKIDMPELQPKVEPKAPAPEHHQSESTGASAGKEGSSSNAKKKERESQREQEKTQKRAEQEMKKQRGKQVPSHEAHKLSKPSMSNMQGGSLPAQHQPTSSDSPRPAAQYYGPPPGPPPGWLRPGVQGAPPLASRPPPPYANTGGWYRRP